MRDLELEEYYTGSENGLQSMKATFYVAEKKFGPADAVGKGSKEIAKITGMSIFYGRGTIIRLYRTTYILQSNTRTPTRPP